MDTPILNLYLRKLPKNKSSTLISNDSKTPLLPNYKPDKTKQKHHSPYRDTSPRKSIKCIPLHFKDEQALRLPLIAKKEAMKHRRSESVKLLPINANKAEADKIPKEAIKKVLEDYETLSQTRALAAKVEKSKREHTIESFQNKFTMNSKSAYEAINAKAKERFKRELEEPFDPMLVQTQEVNRKKFGLLERVEQELRDFRRSPDDFAVNTDKDVILNRNREIAYYIDKDGNAVEVKKLHKKFSKSIDKCIEEMDSIKDIARSANMNIELSKKTVQDLYNKVKAGLVGKVKEILEREPELIETRFSVIFPFPQSNS